MSSSIVSTFIPQRTSHTEQQFVKTMRRKGYRIISRGWPDFVCINGSGNVVIVEVKNQSDTITCDQLACLTLLSLYGFDVRIYHPNDKVPGRHLTDDELSGGLKIIQRDGPTRASWRLGFNMWNDLEAAEDKLLTIEDLSRLTGISQVTLLALCINKRIETTPQECDGQTRLFIRWGDFRTWVVKSAMQQYSVVSGNKTISEFVKVTKNKQSLVDAFINT